ncbi:MAG: signal peptide peptidase SppA [Eubacterium sp.]|nr:signal peptide peptidase SppA [Eubacterium sp.]
MEENNDNRNEMDQQDRQNSQYERPYPPQKQYPPQKKTSVIPIIAIVIAVFLVFGSIFSFIMRLMTSPLLGRAGKENAVSYSTPYIGVLTVNGTIEGDSDSLLSEQSYHHSWTLKKIKELKSDSNNRGLIIKVNTPGGGVYESDELYFAIKDYKEATGRPVYSYMMSQATSGGYYISAPCDKIIANRNCWTGSIGVTIGTLYDITGFLKKHGVRTVTITSGANKAMGSYTDEMTDEQRDIFQSLVDDAYDQFVGIVAEGRKMDEKKARKIGDGRVYTAKQAKKNGLIDAIASYDDAVKDMKKRFELDSCTVNDIEYKEDDSIFSKLMKSLSELKRSNADSEMSTLKALMDENRKFTVTYLAEVER